jgi:hypothetical protein
MRGSWAIVQREKTSNQKEKYELSRTMLNYVPSVEECVGITMVTHAWQKSKTIIMP